VPTNDDLTPEQWEDLIDSDHACDERCFHGHHDDHLRQDVDVYDHRLALEECGLDGNAGTIDPRDVTRILWRRATEFAGCEPGWDHDTETLLRVGRIYNELVAQWREEFHARFMLQRAIQDTERAVREYNRLGSATLKRAEPRIDRRSPNRPTRVDVDPRAWQAVKSYAIVEERKVADVVGELLTRPLPEPTDEVVVPQRRFARLFIDDERWKELRTEAVSRSMIISRLIGVVVEHEAKQLGWTAGAR